MKTSVLALITAVTIAAFVGCQAQKKEEAPPTSTSTTTHGASTTKKSSTTKKTSTSLRLKLRRPQEEDDREEGRSIAFPKRISFAFADSLIGVTIRI